MELPAGTAALTLPRSGLAAEHGIALVNAPGLIDSGYRGEVRIILLNTDRETAFEVRTGDRIAQLLVVSLHDTSVIQVEELAESERGTRGFGSSGRASETRHAGETTPDVSICSAASDHPCGRPAGRRRPPAPGPTGTWR